MFGSTVNVGTVSDAVKLFDSDAAPSQNTVCCSSPVFPNAFDTHT